MTRIRRGPQFTARLVNTAGSGQHPDVLADLRAAILAGDEPPGTPIPVDRVAAFFGVSQIPVREALKTLTGEGLVEHTPHVGYAVAKLTFAEFCELYEVRQALETSALAAALRQAGPADDEAALAAHTALTEVIAAGDLRGYHAQSRRFHLALIAPAQMQRLVHMYEAAWNLTEPARPMARISAESRAGLHAEHAAMLEAFLARNVDRLLAESHAHYRHLRGAIEALRDDPDVFRPAV